MAAVAYCTSITGSLCKITIDMLYSVGSLDGVEASERVPDLIELLATGRHPSSTAEYRVIDALVISSISERWATALSALL